MEGKIITLQNIYFLKNVSTKENIQVTVHKVLSLLQYFIYNTSKI